MTEIPPAMLDPEIATYIGHSYPHNHDYRLVKGRLKARWKLWKRDWRIRRLLPTPLESLVDLSVCKGWFAIQAAQREGCGRVLGIDVHEPDLAAARAVRDHLGLGEQVRLEKMLLHELAESIADHGGPFQTALLVNVYQYLYFGSRRCASCYSSHEEIFDHLRSVCDGRLIFSNRVELHRCPRHIQAWAREQGRGEDYTEQKIAAAASRHFRIERRGKLGRIPLWSLEAR